jgi:hypothetical protein
VTVKGYVDRIGIVADSQVIATHLRSYGRGEKVLDPLHFLAVLERKPATLDLAPVYRDWQLPAAFADLRRELEARLGPRAGIRQYIRVLQLLAHHSVERVERIIRFCQTRGATDAIAVTTAVEQLACNSDIALSVNSPSAIPKVSVPLPDLSQFDQLLSHSSKGVAKHERRQCHDAESQSQATAAADDAGRVGEAGS